MKFLQTVAIMAFSFTIIQCTKGAGGEFQADQNGEHDAQIISDRPLKTEPVIATIKLTSPSLLEAAVKTEKGLVVPDAAKQAVEREQTEIIQKLKSVSSDIQILYRYKMILNGIAFVAPPNVQEQLQQIPGVKALEPSHQFSRPMVDAHPLPPSKGEGFKTTSVDFIEATRVQNELKTADGQPVRGQGMRVGVIDTGVDYTHSMLGGSGRAEDYKAIDPAKPSQMFPNRKVVGGIDLVGSDFNAASDQFDKHIPKPDANPIDEAAHGSHVSGTIAGIGDGVNTYSGVAPDASIYAIKVFGADGSTSDYVVAAALEYAADPNGDGNPDDRLDVVNLSLGGGFGQPMILYTEAIRNLTKGGTVVVASAGNSGAIDYIVGAPSTADDALSVAASVDNMPHNWTFPAAVFTTPSNPELTVRAVEGPISAPVAEHPEAKGQLVYIGLGDRGLTEEEAKAVKGQIAFMDRGKVPFLQKLTLAAKAGALGVVVANNQPGDPIPMGGEGSVTIPAIMITKDVADSLKNEMKAGVVSVVMSSGKTIEEPRLIDTITNFSSKGPRSMDSLLKPEITAPGLNITSAAMGSGDKGVQFSGTSMSGPHMAGVMTLLKQVHPDLSVEALKSLAMSTTKLINDEKGHVYPLSVQGAGRIRAFAAATAPLTIAPAAISVGNVQVGTAKTVRRELTITNITDHVVNVSPTGQAGNYLRLNLGGPLTLAAGQSAKVPVLISLAATPPEQTVTEINGEVLLNVTWGPATATQAIPVLAMVTKQSEIEGKDLKVYAPSKSDASDAASEFTLVNRGSQSGVALPFNLIGFDRRKPQPGVTDSFRSRSCDLESAGYRIIRKTVDGEEQDVLQIAVKLYEPVTTWILCEVSVQIDTNGDQLADQELAGIAAANLSGLNGMEFKSLLLDAVKAREIRKTYEEQLASGKAAGISYVDALLDVQAMTLFNHSTVAVVEAPMKEIGLRPNGDLAVKIATLYGDSEGYEPDDFLGGELNRWTKLASTKEGTSFYGMPESIEVAPGQQTSVSLSHGAGTGSLIVYFPNNSSRRPAGRDPQTKVLKPAFAGAK